MWDNGDRTNYVNLTRQQVGQITGDTFSAELTRLASDTRNKTFLEIGTWNGLGSTRAFVDGLSTRNDDYVFYSLECNSDKAAEAARLYSKYDKVHILNEVIWNEEPADFYEIFPQCKTNAMYKHWNTVDLVNMKRCKLFLERDNLPARFDVVLLDGGEFTTYHEFQLLKGRCNTLLLDDINVAKCTRIVEELKQDTATWKITAEVRDVRNGYLMANLKN